MTHLQTTFVCLNSSGARFSKVPVTFRVRIEIYGVRARILAYKLLHFVSSTDGFIRCKTIETSIFNVNGNSLPGPLIIGTFEKQAPGPKNDRLQFSSNSISTSSKEKVTTFDQ